MFDIVLNGILLCMELSVDTNNTKGSLDAQFDVNASKNLMAILQNTMAKTVHNSIYFISKAALDTLNFTIPEAIMDGEGNNVLPRMMQLIMEGNCASVSYLFNYSITWAVYWQRVIAAMAVLVSEDYSNKINFTMSTEAGFGANGDLEWASIFEDLGTFILENLDLMFRMCNLTNEAERVNETSKIFAKYLDEYGDSAVKNTQPRPEDMPILPPDYTQKVALTATVDGYTVNINEYVDLLHKSAMGVGFNLGAKQLRYFSNEAIGSQISAITNRSSIEYIIKEGTNED